MQHSNLYLIKIIKKCLKSKNHYGGGNTAEKVLNLIESFKFNKEKIIIKKFNEK